jgi:cytoskeletal protein CcmA (bactofilin family)
MAATQAEPGLSIIAATMRVVGDVESDGVVKIEGRVEGSVRVARQVLVAKGGLVDGEIQAREAIIGGEVRGNISATERLEIQPQSVVHGDITTKLLLVQEGGEVNGVIRMGTGALAETATGAEA